jgi:hypothetical protein
MHDPKFHRHVDTRRHHRKAVMMAATVTESSGHTFPGGDVPGYHSEVHHVIPYAKCPTTDVNHLTFGCGGHHPLAERGWNTRKNANGDTEWIPPHTWITGSQEPTPITTRKNSSVTATTRRTRSGRA